MLARSRCACGSIADGEAPENNGTSEEQDTWTAVQDEVLEHGFYAVLEYDVDGKQKID